LHRFKEIYLLGLLALWLLAACASYAAVVLYTADAREAVALAGSYPPHWPASGSAAAGLAQLRLVLAGTAVALGALGAVLARHLRRRGLADSRLWLAGWRLAWRQLAQGWRALSARQRRWAGATFAVLTLLRIIINRTLVGFDDSASYEYFVRRSLLVVSADYSSPNNHIFNNTLSWLFYQVYPGFWWSMRLPVLLLSTAGTAGWFLGLLRHTSFQVAALAITLFSFLELSLFYAAEGRGYALLTDLSGLGFFCVLGLAGPATQATGPKQAWAWSGLALAGVLGLYTVPTFAYFLVAAYSWLGVCWLRQAAYSRLASLGVLGATTLLGAGLLYAPLLVVSGPAALVHNEFVKPLAASAFFRQLPGYVWRVEGALMGEAHKGVLASWHVGSLAAVAVVVGFAGLVRAARRGRLPTAQAASVRGLGMPALWFAGLPYALLLEQRVQAPDRTLLFKAVFMFLLVGLLADWLLVRFAAKARPLRAGLLLAVGLWAGVQLAQLHKSNKLRLSYLRTPHAAARWLLQQPPGPILASSPAWTVANIQFYIHFEDPASALRIDGRPGVRYRYVIGAPAAAAASAERPGLHIGRGANSDALDIVAYW
jgi:hypothetical protein